MRYLFGFLCVCALGVVPLVGCSETTGNGGTGGSAGSGGDGGTGGVIGCDEDADCDDGDLCTTDSCAAASPFGGPFCVNSPVDCDDRNDCTANMCNPANGECTTTPVADGTLCAGGTCRSGACELTDSLLPCTEQGIRNAIAAGGDDPYTFECDRPENIILTSATIAIVNDVILDGEGKLTLDGVDAHGVFSVPDGVTAELRGFAVVGGSSENEAGGIDIAQGATMTLTNSTVAGSRANQGGGIANDGTLTMTNCTVQDNVAEDGRSDGIFNAGTLTMTNCTVSRNGDTGIPGPGQQPLPRGAILNEGTMTLLSCTLSGDIESTASDSATLMNTLLDGECEGDDPTSSGYNVESPGNTCGFDEAEGDQFGVTPEELNLGELADTGGPPQTRALGLLPTPSVAIDRIPEANCVDADGAPLTTDQRGEPRPVAILGPEPKCDVGSFERQSDDP
jgi:hypothetical protein